MGSTAKQTRIALVGNPNSGKTTMFNELTGSNQHVGNWPGVTVEKKEGKLKGKSDVIITDLPGIYSLSPYTLEEVVSRDYLLNVNPNGILNLVDATNLERNLYLTTQILELGIPTVIALNMIDLANKRGDKIDGLKLGEVLGCPVISTSALRNEGVIKAAEKAAEITGKPQRTIKAEFSKTVESALANISGLINAKVKNTARLRWYAVKVFERDEKVLEQLRLSPEIKLSTEKIIKNVEALMDDESDSIIANERYDYIEKIVRQCLKKGKNKISVTEKIDNIVTNRILALPIFIAVMFFVYYISVTTIGAWVTDWTNDVLFGEIITPGVESWMTGLGVSHSLIGLVVDGIIGGVGGVLGFVPQMLVLFLLLSLLEDCGYMARVAFIMDRLFRKFGLSGKSFIPMLISTGCGVPGIMASKTIENEKDRRMTIMTTTFMPCSAKVPIIALIAGALFGGAWWVAPSAYFVGVAAIIISGIILKKTKMFAGETAPFVMELPDYHAPKAANILRSTWERGWGFIKRASSVILVASVVIWFTSSYGWINGSFGAVEDTNHSILGVVGNAIKFIFIPLGFGQRWEPVVATLLGLLAKEEVVGAMGTMAAVSGDALQLVEGMDFSGITPIAMFFSSPLASYAFLLFNLLCAPCFAAMGAIRREMNSGKWTAFAIGYQTVFAYVISLVVFQIGSLFTGGSFGFWTAVAFVLAAAVIYLMVRPDSNSGTKLNSTKKVSRSAG